MRSSYKIFSVKGIDISLHFTLLVLFLMPALDMFFYQEAGNGLVSAAYSFLFLITLFSSVLAHELAHSFIALRNKVTVKSIILTPIGGIANVGPVSEPMKELKISLAGPLMSLGIGFCVMFLLIGAGAGSALTGALSSGSFMDEPSVFNFFVLAMYVNIVLGAFNLFLPIFPMDGGRVLRSLLGMLTDHVKATRIAVYIGQAFLIVFVAFAAMLGSIWLIAIAVFLFLAGWSELRITEMSELLKKTDFRRAVHTNFIVLHPDMPVGDFLKIAVPWQSLYPVLDESRKPLGIITPDGVKGGKGTIGGLMTKRFPVIKPGEEKSNVLQKVYSEGYALVLDKGGALYGILTLQNLEKTLNMQKR
jgi:Zn-dependent protease